MCQTNSKQVVTDFQQKVQGLHPNKVSAIRAYSIEDALAKTSECAIQSIATNINCPPIIKQLHCL